MSRFGTVYERIRPLIVWLGLGELAWIGSWVLNSGDTTRGYVATAVVWLVLMLAWMALVIYLGNLGVFLKHTRWLSNHLWVRPGLGTPGRTIWSHRCCKGRACTCCIPHV